MEQKRIIRAVGIFLCAMAIGLLTMMDQGVGSAAGDPALLSKPAPLPTLTLTLRDALAAAVDNNPDVQLYKERIEAAQGQVQTQLGALLPNLSMNVRQTQQTQFLGTFGLSPVRTDPFNIFDTRVNASQNILSISLIQRWRASRERLHVVEFEADIRKFDTMASVALLYMEALKAMGMVKMHESNQQVMSDLLGVVKHRQKNGIATGLDIARLEAQLASERQRAASARYDVQHAKLNLLNLLSLPYETPVVLSDEFKADVADLADLQTAVDEALTNRPEVQAQMTKVKVTELTYSSITGERLPSLVAQGDYGLIGNRWNNSLDTYNVALLLQIPIFDGAQREGRIAESRSQLRQEALRMRSVLNQVKMEVHDAAASLAAAQEQVGIARIGMQAATKEIELAKERYAVMTAASHFELTNGLSALARARENLVNALFQLNAGRVNLARSTGSLKALN
ncbi:MAG: TolC family protein [Nitrospira sp. CG24C]|nr:MAG: TolC family protein [Nitrospira sp. CG24C]TKB53392.1 MAG: TolC family protein [Nitrospira sp.]